MKILVTGDAIVDHYIYGEVERHSPEDDSIPVVDVTNEEYRLGGCLNVAANIRSLSFAPEKGDPLFEVNVSTIFSPFIGYILNRKGILADDSNIGHQFAGNISPSQREIIKTRIINRETMKQIARIDNRKKYFDMDIDLYNMSIGPLKIYDAIVVSDYRKGLVSEEFLENLKSFKGLIFVDTKNPNLSIWKDYKNCIVKLNDKEFSKSRGKDSLSAFIVTEGVNGCTLYNYGQQNKHFPTKSVKNPEVTGAGDVFLSGLVVKYMLSEDIHESIKFANKAARFSVTQKGTTEVSTERGQFYVRQKFE